MCMYVNTPSGMVYIVDVTLQHHICQAVQVWFSDHSPMLVLPADLINNGHQQHQLTNGCNGHRRHYSNNSGTHSNGNDATGTCSCIRDATNIQIFSIFEY